MTEAIDPFRIRALVPDFAEQQAGYVAASEATRAALRSQRDLAYGPGPRERLDLFFPHGEARGLPVHIFIHGGYWRANAKEDYAFVADTVTRAGAIAAIVEYALMPGARLAELVAQVRRAAAWLGEHAVEFGGDAAQLSASGHSAGAHLCSYLASRSPHEGALPTPRLRAVLLVSGIYDLRPITRSFLQAEIGLTPEEVARWSPIEAVPDIGTAFEIAVGHAESEPFHTMAHDYAYGLERRGAPVERITLPGLEHMSIVRQMGVAGSAMAGLVGDVIDKSRR